MAEKNFKNEISDLSLDVRSALRLKQKMAESTSKNPTYKKISDKKQKGIKVTDTTDFMSETVMYKGEKINAFKDLLSIIPVFLKHGINTKKYLQNKADAKEEEEVSKLIDLNFYEGEIEYNEENEEFENKIKNFGGMEMTSRELYQSLIVDIENKLRNTAEGKKLCLENIVKTDKDYEHFANVIFSIIEAFFENKQINDVSISSTARYLDVPAINVMGICSRPSFSEVVKFAENILFSFISDPKEKNNDQNENDIVTNSDDFDINLEDEEQDYLFSNIYQEVFSRYKGDVSKTEENLKEVQNVACAWYCFVRNYYTKDDLTNKDWQNLETFLETLNKMTNNFIDNIISKGLDEDFVKAIINKEDFRNIFLNHVFNNLVTSITNQKR